MPTTFHVARRPAPLRPEGVMAQLETEAALARLPDPTTRHLVIVIIETGLRAGDACRLRVDCLVPDIVGWPCLRFTNNKVCAEQLIPSPPEPPMRSALSRSRSPDAGHPRRGCPRVASQPRWGPPVQLQRPATANGSLEQGDRPTRPRRPADAGERPCFRHTLGTRPINQGVPQHVVQRLLGHASPQMTATCATRRPQLAERRATGTPDHR